MIVHAGLIAMRVDGAWKGVLIEGPSGVGKSDLALRALAQGFRLVADDRTLLWASGGRLYGRAPDALFGMMEVRGLDVVAHSALPFCEVGLIARCGPVERAPDPEYDNRLGVCIPVIGVAALEASAPAKLSRALRHLGQRSQQAYQPPLAARSLLRSGGDSR